MSKTVDELIKDIDTNTGFPTKICQMLEALHVPIEEEAFFIVLKSVIEYFKPLGKGEEEDGKPE